MASSISNTTPGKRGAEVQERSVRQKQESTELSYLERLPFELKRMVAEHLQSRDDLKNLAEVSADWKDVVLEVINLQNMHAAVEELKDLANLDPDEPDSVLSAMDVYKSFLFHENDDYDDDFLQLLDETTLPQLRQTLTAISTQQLAERVNAIKQDCCNDIGLRQASYDSIDQKYADLKYEFVVQALEHIISASTNPEYIRSQIVECAAQNGDLKIVRALLADEAEISDEGRGWAVKKAAEKGHLEIVRFLLADGAEISDEDRGCAVKRAAYCGHLSIVRYLLADGAEISDADRGVAIQRAAYYGHLDIAQFLLENGTQISAEARGSAIRWASTRGHLDIVRYLLADGAEISEGDRELAIEWALQSRHNQIAEFLRQDKA